MGKASRRKGHERRLTYLIQTRLTLVSDIHVCMQCGGDASLLEVSYEVATQEQADRIVRDAQHKTVREVVESARTSPVSDAIYEATLREQRQGPPQEHFRSYRCSSCAALLLIVGTGISSSGEEALAHLQENPRDHAVFCVQRIADPGRTILLSAPFQDVGRVLRVLRRQDS